jgi:hypothetical protein
MKRDIALSQTIPAFGSEDGHLSPSAAICEQTVRIAVERYGADLRAIVLTGSLARDEGTFLRQGTCWKLLGDADFFLVFHDWAPLHPSAELESASQAIADALYENGLVASIGLASERGRYFQKLPRHVLTYELRTRGRVIWGDASILSLVPAFPAKQILLEDAWRLLANRIIEELEAVAVDKDIASPKVQYCTVKLYLDMATSYLIFAGRYVPTYADRERELSLLAHDPSAQCDAPFSLERFAERVSACTRFKLTGRGLTVSPEALWRDGIDFAQSLWNWELQKLTGSASNSCSDLMSAWMVRQSLKDRVRGWLSVMRRCGWRRSWPEWPRWTRLGWRGSPRYWVYSVATEIFFLLPTLISDDSRHTDGGINWTLFAGKLPLFEQAEPVESFAEAPKWQQLAHWTALNYHSLLESTAA